MKRGKESPRAIRRLGLALAFAALICAPRPAQSTPFVWAFEAESTDSPGARITGRVTLESDGNRSSVSIELAGSSRLVIADDSLRIAPPALSEIDPFDPSQLPDPGVTTRSLVGAITEVALRRRSEGPPR